MAKKTYIFLFLILGLLLGPMQTYAHNGSSKATMACCKDKSTKKNCCKENQSTGSNHSCDNSCSGVSCSCPVAYCGVNFIFALQEQNNSHFYFSDNKQKFFYSETIISSDFCSIWLPPKLS